MRTLERLTDAAVKKLAKPTEGNRITYDDLVAGFGIRVTAKESRAFVFNYRSKHADNFGQERRITIGDFPDWSVTAAREYARELRRMVDTGRDPLGERNEARDADTIADLCKKFERDHFPHLRPGSRKEYKRAIDKDILPAWRSRKAASITPEDVDTLHRRITERGAHYTANRVVAVVSKMFSMAIRWRMRPDNPAKGVEKNQEHNRERYLSLDEYSRLTKAMDEHRDQQAMNIFRICVLTGARSGQVKSMRWKELDLAAGRWTKLSSHTKQKKTHTIPLSPEAVDLLQLLPQKGEFVFPHAGGHRTEIKDQWAQICKAAGLWEKVTNRKGKTVERHNARIHDLRHSFASLLINENYNDSILQRLLGHATIATTARYTHLREDVQRKAAEHVGNVIPMRRTALAK